MSLSLQYIRKIALENLISTINKTMKTKLPPVEDVFGSRVRVKILKTLAQCEELTISLLIKMTKTNHIAAKKHLDYLKQVGLVQEKKFGRIAIFRYRIEDMKARSFAKFIQIWESPIE